MRPRIAPGSTPKLTKSRTVSGHSSDVMMSDPRNWHARATLSPNPPKTRTAIKRDIIVQPGETADPCEFRTDNPAATDVSNASMIEKVTAFGSRIEIIIHHALFHPE